jgi:hypothetical protein
MSLVTCHYCLGSGEVFNGRGIWRCQVCKGTGVEEELDQEEIFPERLFPDDRVPFDDESFYTDD